MRRTDSSETALTSPSGTLLIAAVPGENRMSRTLMTAAAAGAALLSIQAAAQTGAETGVASSAEATLYSKGRFKGPSKTVIGPTQFAQPFVMKSVMIAPGA